MTLVDCAVVILAHNGAPFTRYCLESILGATVLPAELFLIDNASDDETPRLLQEMAPRCLDAGIALTTWRNRENKGCSLARNEAWRRVGSTYTVFLDNDAAVCTPAWLGRFLALFGERPQLGILGPKLIYPYEPHPIQCAGVSISRLGRIAFRGRGDPRHDPRYCSYWPTWCLISACWMMRTDLRERVGMLDECFHPVQYEDLDLCIRARQAGFEVAYTPTVEMYHFEGITTAAAGQSEYRRNIARNSLTFRARYHDLFKTFTEELPPAEYRWRQRHELHLTSTLDLRYSD
jgi:O-antigen biosynthesis protein